MVSLNFLLGLMFTAGKGFCCSVKVASFALFIFTWVLAYGRSFFVYSKEGSSSLTKNTFGSAAVYTQPKNSQKLAGGV